MSDVELTLIGSPTGIALYLGDTPPTDVAEMEPIATDDAAERSRITVADAPTGRYLTVWLTSLPQVPAGSWARSPR